MSERFHFSLKDFFARLTGQSQDVPMKEEIVWHYTTIDGLDVIMSDRHIRPAITGVEPGARPAVWFSSNPGWEHTADKIILMTPDGPRPTTKADMQAFARIAVAWETAPHDWKAYTKISGASNEWTDSMANVGIEVGARTREWFFSFDAVPEKKWLCIEIWEGGEWGPMRFLS